jgi:hypothetical protein
MERGNVTIQIHNDQYLGSVNKDRDGGDIARQTYRWRNLSGSSK